MREYRPFSRRERLRRWAWGCRPPEPWAYLPNGRRALRAEFLRGVVMIVGSIVLAVCSAIAGEWWIVFLSLLLGAFGIELLWSWW